MTRTKTMNSKVLFLKRLHKLSKGIIIAKEKYYTNRQ